MLQSTVDMNSNPFWSASEISRIWKLNDERNRSYNEKQKIILVLSEQLRQNRVYIRVKFDYN
jgi:hypothetical protein